VTGDTHNPESGFTLVELLVALTLLALLSVALFGSFRLGARAWDRTTAHTNAIEDVRVAQDLLRQEIASAYPLYSTADPTHPRIDFEGRRERIRFLAPAPAALGGAGMAYFTLSTDADGGEKRVLLSVRLELANEDSPTASATEALVDDIQSLDIAYYGTNSADTPATWLDQWVDAVRLPRLVRVRVRFPEGDLRVWPDLLVIPEIAVDQACAYDPLTKYCRGR
jgi:general secretion pathway protein J